MGYRLGNYELREQLGVGSFGITYLAYDRRNSRKVAIKELLPTMFATRCDTVRVVPHGANDEGQWRWAQDRFVTEAQTLAACVHPNVLRVFEVFRANGTAYMVTQYEEGCTLTKWLKRLGRAPSESELRGILEPLLSALETVHARQFLHRDIKPDNIYMANGNRPVLIDFGSARQDVANRSAPMTAIVTEGYAPFEQYMNGHQGPWTDVYALAAVLYSVIVGKSPPSAMQRTAARANDPCICLSTTYASRYSAKLLQSIDAGLRLDARTRTPNTQQWRRMLSGAGPLRMNGMRTPLVVVAALLLLTAVVAALLVTMGGSTSAPAVEAQAEALRQKQIAEENAAQAQRRAQMMEDENKQLKRRLDQQTPQPVAPVTYTPPPTTYTPPAPTPGKPGLPDGFDDFFKTVYQHNGSDAGTWAADFASPAYYCYANGPAQRSSIQNDRQKLTNRYPNRWYSAPNVKSTEVISPDKVRLTYTFSYRYSGANSASGSSSVTMVSDKSSGRWQITSFEESVLRQ